MIRVSEWFAVWRRFNSKRTLATGCCRKKSLGVGSSRSCPGSSMIRMPGVIWTPFNENIQYSLPFIIFVDECQLPVLRKLMSQVINKAMKATRSAALDIKRYEVSTAAFRYKLKFRGKLNNIICCVRRFHNHNRFGGNREIMTWKWPIVCVLSWFAADRKNRVTSFLVEMWSIIYG